MINFLIRNGIKALLGLRYRVRVSGLREIAQRGRRGILFLPNHPAFIDPVIVMSRLHERFAPRALGDKDQMERFYIRWFAKRVGVRPMLDLARHGPGAREQVASVVAQCAEGLRSGENLLLYPAGHLYRSHLENLRGNSAVESILRETPQARVVLVRTRGLWGSVFSFADGEFPSLLGGIRKCAPYLLANFIFFSPRRRVTIELVEPDDFPRTANREQLNAYLERFYNEDAPPRTYVPYTIWERGGVRELADRILERGGSTVADVPETTRRLVHEHLRELTGIEQFGDEDRLAQDLGLDSLSRSELVVWLGREFGFHGADVASLQTVGHLLLAARGEASASRLVELKRVPRRWFARRSEERARAEAGERITDVFLRQAARGPSRIVVADQIAGAKSFRDLIVAILVLKPLIEEMPGRRVGIMLPASVGASITYLATLFAGKVPVMVNWTTGARNIKHALDLTEVQRVLTVGPMVARIESQGTDLSAMRDRFVLLEELRTRISTGAKLSAWIKSRTSWKSLRRAKVADEAAVLLTSGSETLPKAVPLTHVNILTNLRDLLATLTVRQNDRMIGFLPPFHSFGLTVTLALPMAAGVPVVYHADPTEAWVLARLIEAYGATILVGTPTFLSGIVRAASEGQLDSLRWAVTGAEQCPARTYEMLSAACPNAVVLEGYGITECSPIVAANNPDDPRPFTIGKVMPSLEYAVVDLDTWQAVATNQTGLLLVRGPSVFSGYLGRDAESPFVDFDQRQWYRTGDLVSESEDGVLTFRGRLKRFVKLGGEMVSLPAIEAVLAEHFASEKDEGPVIAVESTPRDDQPEIVLFSTRATDRQTVNRYIREADLSGLHNISRVVRIDEIPLLGTGKTDYRALKEQLSEA